MIENPNGLLTYQIKIKLTERVLASAPANAEVYKQFIQTKKREEQAAKGGNGGDLDAALADELASLPAQEQEKIGWSVFHQDESGLLIYDYHLRGFLKESATAITGKALSAYKSKIDKWVFVKPRKLYFTREGQRIMQADGNVERPIRVMTMQGPRVSVKRSDCLEPPVELEAQIVVLPLGQKEFTEDLLRSWFEYGSLNGLGEWRTGSNGRFEFELSKSDGQAT